MSFLVTTTQIFKLTQPFNLKCGGVLPGFQLIYETYGELNSQKNNAVLVCHALSAGHHLAGYYHDNPENIGWFDDFVGEGKAIDTRKFYVIGVNNIGGCYGSTGPSSIDPCTGEKYAGNFPMVTVEDWVRTQALLADELGINKFAAIVGGSLGGMQALQWSLDFPNRLANAVIIASAPKLSAQNIAFNDVARQAIINDPEFFNGNFYAHDTVPRQGLRVARMMGHITYLSDLKLDEKFGRSLRNEKLNFSYEVEFEVESYLRYQGDKFANFFDANTYLLMTKALDYFDPAHNYAGNLTITMAQASCKFLVLAFNSDWRFSPARSWELVSALLANNLAVAYSAMDSEHGHDSFLIPDPEYVEILQAYFANIEI